MYSRFRKSPFKTKAEKSQQPGDRLATERQRLATTFMGYVAQPHENSLVTAASRTNEVISAADDYIFACTEHFGSFLSLDFSDGGFGSETSLRTLLTLTADEYDRRTLAYNEHLSGVFLRHRQNDPDLLYRLDCSSILMFRSANKERLQQTWQQHEADVINQPSNHPCYNQFLLDVNERVLRSQITEEQNQLLGLYADFYRNKR